MYTSRSEMKTLYLESYYGGSHKRMIDLLQQEYGGDIYSLPATKWNWRMRTSALHFSETIPKDKEYNVLFASSVLNLCELVALRPDLSKLYKLYYFHENQLVYPVRKQQDRDFQHGYAQILSCLVADKVIFNSHYNKDSFLNSIQAFMNLVPDYRPKHLDEKIVPKCSVLYFPVEMQRKDEQHHECNHKEVLEDRVLSKHALQSTRTCNVENLHPKTSLVDEVTGAAVTEVSSQMHHKILHIVWPHRWEHDKGPEEFCAVLLKLVDVQLPFKVSVLGSHTNDIPDCMQKMFAVLGERVLHKGNLPHFQYREVLTTADVVVSTAKHEFYGVAMLEAVFSGCYPLCPNRLVYPEIYPSECLYNTDQQLFKRLRHFCLHPSEARDTNIKSMMSLERFSWTHLNRFYEELFKRT